jgi:hypothetical protein
MRPIGAAIAVFGLLAGLTAPVSVLMQPAPEALPAAWITVGGDPGIPYGDATCNGIVQTAIEDGLGIGATGLVPVSRSGSYGSVVADGRGAEGMDR